MIWISATGALVNGNRVVALPPRREHTAEPTAVTDRDGSLWLNLSGVWYRRERSGGYGTCRGTYTMLERDFGPLAVRHGGAR